MNRIAETRRSISRGLVVATAALLSIAATNACGNKEKDDTPPPKTTVTTPAEPTSTGPTVITTAEAPQPTAGVTPRVKAELDNRSDGITGTPLAAAGATASLQSPTGWAQTKGDVTVAATADKKSQIAATSGDSGTKLAAATAAMGLTDCVWGGQESVTLGKSKLAATAADGTCKRGTVQVATAWVAPATEKLLVVGSWDPDGDSTNVFGAMRSTAKAGGGGPDGITACCNALSGNMASAPPDQKMAYAAALAVCNGIKSNPQARSMLGQVRGALKGAGVPPACN